MEPIGLKVNGNAVSVTADEQTPLLDILRNHLGLMGTKFGCGLEQCGCCMVLVDGRPQKSCGKSLSVVAGKEIVTIEGLGSPSALHPLQKAFLERDAFQCGYCTPGQICSAVALLDEARAGTVSAATPDVRESGPVALSEDEIRERMSGNICRCGAYVNIVAAIRDAAGRTTT